MKRLITRFTLLIAFIFPFVANAQMDNLANMSAKWIRLNARNAAFDGADIVNYNPAGLVKLNDGLHLSLNNQSLFRSPQHSFTISPLVGKQTSEQNGSDPFLPAFYAAYKKSKWALATGIYVTGGGASADYPDGSVNTNLMGYSYKAQINATTPANYQYFKDQSLKASSYYLAIPLNLSYSITEKLAVSLGGRYIIAKNHTKAGMTFAGSTVGAPEYPISIDYKNEAKGFGGIVGLNYSVNDKLNVAIHYETKVKLEFEVKDNKGTNAIAADGTKSDRDLPAALYTGISYKFSDKFSTLLDFNYYFQKGADWGETADPSTGKSVEVSEIAGNCYHVALGLQYQILPKILVSAGCKYIHFDYDNQKLYYASQIGAYESIKYDNFNLGIGAAYNVTDKITVDLGVGRTFWKDKDIQNMRASNMSVDISNKAYVVALGVDVSF